MMKCSAMWKILLLLVAVSAYCTAKPLRKKVCIIGAGPAGLTSLKQLSEWSKEFKPIVFEQNSQIGGQWVYTDKTDVNEHGAPIHSSVYKNLKIWGARELMAFPDYPEHYTSREWYLRHHYVLDYLQNYTRHFDLEKYIRLNRLVEKVSAVHDDQWVVKTLNLETKKHDKTLCDAVMVCNGALAKPNVPEIPGIESFPGQVMHSHVYRHPEDFANQTVIVLGNSVSGSDISDQVNEFATKVYLSHRGQPHDYDEVEHVPGVVAANGSYFILSNGSSVFADTIILCTGYLHDYPFFAPSVGIRVEKGRYVHPLYKHFIHAERPTMAVMNIIDPGLPFPTAYVQARYFMSVLRGKIELPSREEMLKDSELKGKSVKKAHYMDGYESIHYYEELAEATGAEPLPSDYQISYNGTWMRNV